MKTISLFVERHQISEFNKHKEFKEAPRYTLQDVDGEYPSLRRLYFLEEDLTEYLFAVKYFDSWAHWQRICECKWFKPYIEAWRTELEIKLKAEALRSIIEESRLGGKNSYNAKQYLIAKGWIPKDIETNRRGRPSKQDILNEASRQALANYKIEDDLKRLEEVN